MKHLRYDIKPYPKDLQSKHYRVGDTKQVYYKVVATGEIVNESEAERVFDQEKTCKKMLTFFSDVDYEEEKDE